MKKKQTFLIICIVLLSIIIVGSVILRSLYTNAKDENKENVKVTQNNSDYELIHEVNNLYDENYLISPTSISYAFLMASEGSNGKTKEQITTLFKDKEFKNINIPNRIGIANALFLKDTAKQFISEDFINILQTKYNSEIITAPFKGPVLINNWVNEHTYGMIPRILNEISPDFVLGLANAIAIDVEWRNQFTCADTTSQEFTLNDGTKTNVVMMHEDLSDIGYFENDDAYGIVKEYATYNKDGENVSETTSDDITLEYIAISPKGNLKDYISNFNKEELDKLYSSKTYSTNKTKYYLELPRYKYDFSLDKFADIMNSLGVTDAFSPIDANFSNMVSNPDLKLYIETLVHSTHIDLSETGTKAATVTYLGFDRVTSVPDYEIKKVTFDKPFMYIIREKNSNDILFFGTVYNPEVWSESTVTCTK